MKKDADYPWFCWFEFRTREVHSAVDFYRRVVGLTIESQREKVLIRYGERWVGEIGQLPIQAAQRGAPNHWLGHIGRVEVGALVDRFVGRGGVALGPARSADVDVVVAGVRDPWGAPVAFTTRQWEDVPSPVLWAQLHTKHLPDAVQLYSTTLGWSAVREVHLGAPWGAAQVLSPNGMDKPEAIIAETANLPGVHPHWLFYFEVSDIERCAKQTVEAGGKVLGPARELWSGGRIVACDDPFGAAFGLIQPGS